MHFPIELNAYENPFRYPYEVSADGQQILAMTFAADGAIQPVTLVQNWTGALKK